MVILFFISSGLFIYSSSLIWLKPINQSSIEKFIIWTIALGALSTFLLLYGFISIFTGEKSTSE